MVSGVSVTPKTALKNSDICDELVMSNENMRFDPKAKEAEEKASLMAEADQVLALTENMLQARKNALLAKHVEGRESL